MANEQKKFISRDAIRTVADIKTEEVYVPEWQARVLVRGMSGTERDRFEASNITGKGANRDINLRNYRARLIIWSVVDDEGAFLFTEKDEDWIGAKSAAALERIVDVARRLSGISNQDVEELVGESESGQSDDSGSN